jgi:serine/threonine protein kinase
MQGPASVVPIDRASRADARSEDCPSCGGPVGRRPFCLRDGTMIARSFRVGEQYEITECLGAGGTGIVFGGVHRSLEKPVAIKLLRHDLAQDPAHAARFLREAQHASRLRHENIVPTIDFGKDAALGLPYLVMDRVHGRTLSEITRELGALPWRRAVSILRQLLRAIAVAHEQGIAHRDLSPRNVVIEPRGDGTERARLCDFGLSRRVDGDDRMTSTGTLVGTPAYMAPEQILGTKMQDARVDLYAWGTIAFELLTGTLPFDAPSPVALIANKLHRAPATIAERGGDPTIPAPLGAIVERCLAFDADARPSSALEVEARLAGIAIAPDGEPADAPIGSYRRLARLDDGETGEEVHLGEHAVTGSSVTIRVLDRERAGDPGAVATFVERARAVARIASDHVVRPLDVGTLDDGRPYSVAERVEGETLRDRMTRAEPIGAREMRAVLVPVASAIAAAHAAGVVHGNVTPERIILGAGRDALRRVRVDGFGEVSAAPVARRSDVAALGVIARAVADRTTSAIPRRVARTIDDMLAGRASALEAARAIDAWPTTGRSRGELAGLAIGTIGIAAVAAALSVAAVLSFTAPIGSSTAATSIDSPVFRSPRRADPPRPSQPTAPSAPRAREAEVEASAASVDRPSAAPRAISSPARSRPIRHGGASSRAGAQPGPVPTASVTPPSATGARAAPIEQHGDALIVDPYSAP